MPDDALLWNLLKKKRKSRGLKNSCKQNNRLLKYSVRSVCFLEDWLFFEDSLRKQVLIRRVGVIKQDASGKPYKLQTKWLVSEY